MQLMAIRLKKRAKEETGTRNEIRDGRVRDIDEAKEF